MAFSPLWIPPWWTYYLQLIGTLLWPPLLKLYAQPHCAFVTPPLPTTTTTTRETEILPLVMIVRKYHLPQAPPHGSTATCVSHCLPCVHADHSDFPNHPPALVYLCRLPHHFCSFAWSSYHLERPTCEDLILMFVWLCLAPPRFDIFKTCVFAALCQRVWPIQTWPRVHKRFHFFTLCPFCW